MLRRAAGHALQPPDRHAVAAGRQPQLGADPAAAVGGRAGDRRVRDRAGSRSRGSVRAAAVGAPRGRRCHARRRPPGRDGRSADVERRSGRALRRRDGHGRGIITEVYFDAPTPRRRSSGAWASASCTCGHDARTGRGGPGDGGGPAARARRRSRRRGRRRRRRRHRPRPPHPRPGADGLGELALEITDTATGRGLDYDGRRLAPPGCSAARRRWPTARSPAATRSACWPRRASAGAPPSTSTRTAW